MIEIKHLSKTFPTSSAAGSFDALKDVNLSIHDGDIFGIIGMSGAGKSTLVRCINMLERPTKGQVLVDGMDIGTLSEKQLRLIRRDITMIFQSFNLLAQRTCLKNICFPMELSGVKKTEAVARAMELLEMVGLSDKANSYPSQLSGGQQQRIAIARALATNPKVLLCDEATSALDPTTTHSILSLIQKINRELGITVVIITHQMSVVEQVCNRVAILDGGAVVEQGEVSEVFSSPQSDAAKRLVFPETMFSTDENEALADGFTGKRIRVVFDGAGAAGKPLIARMAAQEQIFASILFAATKTISAKVYGNMLLGVSDAEEAERTIRYLKQFDDISAEEV